jgi:hypothetical protein
MKMDPEIPEFFCMLVVIYNKQLKESTTLKSIIEYQFDNCILKILNNGPSLLEIDDLFIEKIKKKFLRVEIENHIENMPLSVAYNQFILKNNKANKFILLDDDTIFTQSFVDKVNETNSDYDLELPRISSLKGNVIYYPTQEGKPVTQNALLPADKIFSIGSGMIITSKFVKKISELGYELFDSHFALYGVDFSLFRRMRTIENNGKKFLITSSCVLHHSLSRIEGDMSISRTLERLYDTVLIARHYPSIKHVKLLLKTILKYAVLLKFSYVLLIIKTYFSGYHPRCKKYIIK